MATDHVGELLIELKREMDHLQHTIYVLERLELTRQTRQGTVTEIGQPKRRGRKFMGQAEREQVSARMKAFWAKRRGEG